MVVDCHVHLRDFNEHEKETIARGLSVARDSGVDAVFDMPNTNPPVMDMETVRDRLKLADDSGVKGVFYGTYVGLSDDPEQIKRAVGIHESFFPRVVGFKLYAGHSVGRLGVIGVERQRKVYETLAREDYRGVLAVHAEKEEMMRPDLWNSDDPVSHCYARPEIAEIESVRDQIDLARETGFRGKLHIAHISTPEAVEFVYNASTKEGLDISCGVCPHHFIFDMNKMRGENGLLWKMNPPLRKEGTPNEMLELLREGHIDWVETDHAPHTWTDKTRECMSGVVALPWYDLFLRFLESKDFSSKEIAEVTHDAVVRRFGISIPANNRFRKDRRADYAFNPYEDIERDMGWSEVAR